MEVVNEISAKGIYSSGTAKAIAKNLGISSGLIEEVANSITSMQISATTNSNVTMKTQTSPKILNGPVYEAILEGSSTAPLICLTF